MLLDTEGSLGPGNIELDGDPAPPKEAQQLPIFGHVYCGPTAAWIKMPPGTEVALHPGHIVLDGDPAHQKGTGAPNFRSMSIVAKRLDG